MRFNHYLFLSQSVFFVTYFGCISAKAIVGHNIRQAGAKEFPYVISLMKVHPGSSHSGGHHFCTGVLITRQDALTAAHCVALKEPNNVQLVIGTIDLKNGSLAYPFWWLSYDQWAVTNHVTLEFHTNDIANIRLLSKVPKNIQPVLISILPYDDLYGEQAILAGWGINNQGLVPDILNVANVKILSNPECADKLSKLQKLNVKVNVRILCSFAKPFTLTESGDSGGPLIYRNKLIGINKGTSPGSTIPNLSVQVNVHMCLHFYGTFIQAMKMMKM